MTVQLVERRSGEVTKPDTEEQIGRRERMAVELVSSLISQKRGDTAYGNTELVLVWKEGRLNRIDITDHVSYK